MGMKAAQGWSSAARRRNESNAWVQNKGRHHESGSVSGGGSSVRRNDGVGGFVVKRMHIFTHCYDQKDCLL